MSIDMTCDELPIHIYSYYIELLLQVERWTKVTFLASHSMDKFQPLFGSNSTQALRNALCTFLCLNSFLRPVLLRPDYLQLHEMDKLRDLEVHGKRSGGTDGYEKKLQSEAKWLHDCTH